MYMVLVTVKCLRSSGFIRCISDFRKPCISCAITPGTKPGHLLPRAKETYFDVSKLGRVKIHNHKYESRGMTAVTYQKFEVKAQDSSTQLDILCKTSVLFWVTKAGMVWNDALSAQR